jgi:hypothetical protein
MSRGRFDIVRTNAGWHVVTIGVNGEPLQTSEVLTSLAAAQANIDAVITVACNPGVEVREDDRRGTGR